MKKIRFSFFLLVTFCAARAQSKSSLSATSVDGMEGLSRHYIAVGKYELARGYLNKIAALPADSVNIQLLSRVEYGLFEVDSAEGNYVAAIGHFEAHKKFNDSLYDLNKKRQLQDLQVQYATKKKDDNLQLQLRNIELLKNATLLDQAHAREASATRNWMLGGIAMLLLLLLVGFSRYRLKQKKNQLLEAKQQEITAKNARLQGLLNENEWLLKEVHNRVKNNLQIVMGLLNSQSAYLQDKAALDAMLDSQHRVQAMSLIHQKLYKSKNVSSIYMPEYIHDLVAYLKDTFRSGQHIRFVQEVEPLTLDVSYAVPLGLIINEVITNAIKYAFPFSEDDCITVRLKRDKGDSVELFVGDNGRGLPADFDILRSNSFGMTLISGLTEDLSGDLQVESVKGTAIRIRFEYQEKDAAGGVKM